MSNEGMKFQVAIRIGMSISYCIACSISFRSENIGPYLIIGLIY